jgi:hypothetical protein
VVPPLAVKVVEVPLQIGFAEGEILTVRLGFTLTVTLAVPVHPEVVPVTV